MTCHYCEEKEYIQSQHPTLREDLLSLKQLKGKVHAAKSSNDGDLYYVKSVNNDYVDNHCRWVLDFTVDVHVCKDQAKFTTLQKDRDFYYINVEKKLKMIIEGMERVCLKLHNGKVQDIPNVRYVPTTNVNIILLGKITSHDYKYLGIRKICKMYKGSRLILQDRK